MNRYWPTARRIRPALLFLACAGGAAALASSATAADLADLTIEQLMEIRVEKVVSASRFEQKVTRAPAAVTIVTADEIAAFGHRTLADVLRSVRGFYASNDANYSYLGTRGFLRPNDYNTRLLMLVDGHRMNDNIYDGAYIGRENSIDLDIVERVEVVRGPSSSIYGSSAFFGIVNVVTKRGAQLRGGTVSAEAGSAGTYAGRITVGDETKRGIDWLLSASGYRSDGRRSIYYPEFDQRISDVQGAANNGIAQDWDAETSDHVHGRLTFGDVTVSAAYIRRHKQVPSASFFSVFNDRSEQTTDYRAYVDAKLERSLAPHLTLLGNVSYDHYYYTGDYPFDYEATGDPADYVLNKDFSEGDWVGTEWQLHARLADRYIVIAGAEYRQNFHQDQFNYDYEPFFDYLSNHNESRTLGAYAQLEATLTRQLLLNVGVRHDHHFGTFGGTTNPRLGLIYSPAPATTFKVLYGRAFRAPNAYERTFFTAQRTAPPLQPETIRTAELVWEQYLGRHYRLSVSGYRYELKSLVNQSTAAAEALVFKNLQGAHAAGAEFEFEGRWESGTIARLSYAQQHTEDEDSAEELTSSPRHLAKLNVVLPLVRERLFAGIEGQYYSTMRTLDGARTKDFALANVTLTWRRRNWEAAVSAYNLFDARYGYPGAEDHVPDVLPQEGRTLRFKLTYRF